MSDHSNHSPTGALCLMPSLFQPWCQWHRLARHGSGQPERQAPSSPLAVECIQTSTSARHRRGWQVPRASAMPVELLDMSDGLVQYEEVRSSRCQMRRCIGVHGLQWRQRQPTKATRPVPLGALQAWRVQKQLVDCVIRQAAAEQHRQEQGQAAWCTFHHAFCLFTAAPGMACAPNCPAHSK